MSREGARARPEPDEARRVFEVAGVGLDAAGQVRAVRWCEIDTRANGPRSPWVIGAAADVIDALQDGAEVGARFPGHRHGAPAAVAGTPAPGATDPALALRRPEGRFIVLLQADGRPVLALAGPPVAGRRLSDLASLAADDTPAGIAADPSDFDAAADLPGVAP